MNESELIGALENKAEFTRLVTSNFELLQAAKQFPAHAEALIQKVLRDPKYFDALIKDDRGLLAIKPFCPNIKTIQDATSFPGARSAIKKEMLFKNKESEEAKLTAFFKGQHQMKNYLGGLKDLAEYQSDTLGNKKTAADEDKTSFKP